MESNNKTAEESKSKKMWWLLLLMPLLLVVVWWFSPKKSVTTAPTTQKADIKLCNLGQIAPAGHCCTEEAQTISLYSDGTALSVSAEFPGQGKIKAPVKAVVYWSTGELYPTGDLPMAMDEADTKGCYYTLIKPLHGIKWTPSKYRVQVLVGDEVVGEKQFEIVR